MLPLDPYDYRIAFDDVLGSADVVRGVDAVRGYGSSPDEIVDMAGQALTELRRRQFGSPVEEIVERCDHDPTPFTFEPATELLGADAGVVAGRFPLFDHLRARFRAAIGHPRMMRIDGDDGSYQTFRSARRQQHLDDLDARLTKLEAAVADHTSDHHGGGRVARLEDELRHHLAWSGDHETQVLGCIGDTMRGGRRVSLGNLPPNVECWLDVDEVLVSARLSPRCIITMGQPVQPVIEELVGCAESVGCCGLEALLIGAEFGPSVLGHQLLDDVSRVTNTFGSRGETIFGGGVFVVRPNGDPEMSAAMALLQRTQRGDRQAMRESYQMLGCGYGHVLGEAEERLYKMQARKAGRLS